MLFAYQNGIKKKAEPKEKGTCAICQKDVSAYCGNIMIWHWKHKSKISCDTWNSPMSEWHTNWQLNFPEDLIEVIVEKENIRHFADVKTSSGVVIEFQNSSISQETMKTREEFYGEKMLWVINEEKFNIRINRINFLQSDETFQPFQIRDIKPPGYKNIRALIYTQKEIDEKTKSILLEGGFEIDGGFYWKNLNPFKNSWSELINEIFITSKTMLLKLDYPITSPKIEISFEYKNLNPQLIWGQSQRHVFIDLGNYLVKIEPTIDFEEEEDEDDDGWDMFNDEFFGTLIPKSTFLHKYSK